MTLKALHGFEDSEKLTETKKLIEETEAKKKKNRKGIEE